MAGTNSETSYVCNEHHTLHVNGRTTHRLWKWCHIQLKTAGFLRLLYASVSLYQWRLKLYTSQSYNVMLISLSPNEFFWIFFARKERVQDCKKLSTDVRPCRLIVSRPCHNHRLKEHILFLLQIMTRKLRNTFCWHITLNQGNLSTLWEWSTVLALVWYKYFNFFCISFKLK